MDTIVGAPSWIAVFAAAERPDLWEQVDEQDPFRSVWPEYNHHGNHSDTYFGCALPLECRPASVGRRSARRSGRRSRSHDPLPVGRLAQRPPNGYRRRRTASDRTPRLAEHPVSTGSRSPSRPPGSGPERDRAQVDGDGGSTTGIDVSRGASPAKFEGPLPHYSDRTLRPLAKARRTSLRPVDARSRTIGRFNSAA